MPDLHPDLAPLAPLLGTWAGRGAGKYPTIEPFDYLEEITFSHVGKPFLAYGQRTKSPDDGRPLHAETGYLRVPALHRGVAPQAPLRHTGAPQAPLLGRVEWVLVHPTGITEIEEGTLTVEDGSIEFELASTGIGLATTAKEVNAVTRSFRVVGDELTYTVEMSAVGQPLQHHLSATLRRA